MLFCAISSAVAKDAGGKRKTTSGKENKTMNAGNDIMAALSSWGYGYKVKVLVNGVDIGMSGGKSESKRLFHKESDMAATASPDMRKRNFILQNGTNRISVDFTKTSNEKNDYLQVSLEIQEYQAPLFLLHSRSKPSGKIEKEITIQNSAPDNFKPAVISDKGEGKAAMVHVSSMSATVTPVLNGVAGMTLGDMPGSVVLEGVKLGKNEIIIRYKGEPDGDLSFAVVTPEWTKFLTRKLQDASEKAETFTFNVSD